jgi:hypothetical protein
MPDSHEPDSPEEIEIEFYEPASPEEIAEMQKAIGYPLPEDYKRFLATSNGLFAGSLVSIYSTEEIAEVNLTNEVKKYIPDWLMIGDDSGGYGVFLDLRKTVSPVYLMEMGSLIPAEAYVQANSLDEWIRLGFPLNYD